MFFDNSKTQWKDASFMLIIGKSSYSSVYEMMPDTVADRWYVALPSSGWSDAEYMAVIAGNTVWNKGNWGPDNLKNASHYTATYTAGLTTTAAQGYIFTPQTADNGCTIKLKWLGDDYNSYLSRTFTTEEKNRCYAIDPENETVTFIFSTSSKRFNISKSDIKRVFVYGSITAWDQELEEYRLNRYSDDGCFYRTFPFSMIERLGNSGQPEFIFKVLKTDGSSYSAKHNSSWGENFDKRYLFISNGENMVVAMPGDDIDEIYDRCRYAKYVKPLSEFDLTDMADQLRLSNFRRVPATTRLFRSYHPYDPSREQYDTEPMRLNYIVEAATRMGIAGDIALSGDESKHAGESYSCAGKTYTITIPDYYKPIIANDQVLYVGTRNGHTPDFNHALYRSDEARFAEWIKEVVEWVNDDAHMGPYQIHCAIGADRTGAFSEVIAAICGATWPEIAYDYEATSEMRIQEYRHRNAIRYCLKHLCGVDPATDSSFNEAVRRHFIDGGYLTEAQLDTFRSKMNILELPTCYDKDVYCDITIRAYSPEGAPRIWWWNGGEIARSAAYHCYTYSARPHMKPIEGKDGWYSYTIPTVEVQTGVCYQLTAPGMAPTHGSTAAAPATSESMKTYSDECRRISDFSLMDCPDTPTALHPERMRQMPTKRLVDGQLVIFDGKHVYNAQGAQIR